MILDNQTLLSNAQAITVTAASTNVIDLGPISSGVTRDIGKGEKIALLVQVVETFDTVAEDGTLTIALQLDSTDTFTPDKSIALGTYAEADLVAGFKIPFDYIPVGVNYRYMRLNYTVGGAGAFTTGKITAGVVHGGHQTNG